MFVLAEFIRQAIRAYEPGPHPLADQLREIVAEHEMLPLEFDMAYCVGIRADLSIIGVLWEDWRDVGGASPGPRLFQ